jgi:hypothetical protein
MDLWSDTLNGYDMEKNIKTVDNIENIIRDELGGDCAEDYNLRNDERDESENDNGKCRKSSIG